MDSSNSISLEHFIERSAFVPEIVIDTETNKQDIRDGRGFATGVTLAYQLPSYGFISWYLPFRHRTGYNLPIEFRHRLSDALLHRKINGLPNIYHNAKFDIVSLDTLGIDLYGSNFYCTMNIAHLVNENYFSKELDYLAKHLLGDPGKEKSDDFKAIEKRFGWDMIPSELMALYAIHDGVMTWNLWQFLKPMFFGENLQEYWEHKKHTTRVVQSMESNGVRVDVSLCSEMSHIADQCMEDIKEILGLDPAKPKDLERLLLTELNLPVLKRSQKTNKPSFDKEVMKEYEAILERQENPTAKHILAYRGWSKSKSSNYDSYISHLSPDGRLRPNYKLHGTKTGRFSCSDPNLQQIPRVSEKPWNGRMKKAFISDEGWELWEADYAQLEFRLTAHIAQEPHLLEVFDDEGRDIFTEMSGPLGLVRPDTKTFVYATGYGAGINRIHHALGVSIDRAKQIRSAYWSAYPQIRHASEQAKLAALRNKKIKLWSGRYRHFMWPQSEGHKALNSWCQGGAADFVERKMWQLWSELESDFCHLLLQVHDSVVFAIRSDMVEKLLPEIKRIMEDAPEFRVKFKVDIHRWGE